MMDWYASPEFEHIREIFSQELETKENIRLIVKITDPNLLQTPWNLLFVSFLEMYPNAEIALSVPDYHEARSQTGLLGLRGKLYTSDTIFDGIIKL